ncbi:ATPase [Sneathiella chungangensis]|uniref:ATPase n=1 Tax=Sneathiella chungangensis TaxID=1418234 RepID=A0A845MF89_9PROT|nr:SRPBCC family protein [Sneathiella chungangensis]MZR22529.1 ATPase [Sneathiella chungangensis]
MTKHDTSEYGVLVESATLQIQRMLPGPVERIWAYLTDSDKRRQWLAAGDMEMKVGAPFELVWRNSELTSPTGQRPPAAAEEHRMESKITELDPPRKLSFTWGSTGGVTFELEPRGDKVLLTVTHHRALDRSTLLSVSAGWHAHLDVLAAVASGKDPTPFWDNFNKLKQEYDDRLPT